MSNDTPKVSIGLPVYNSESSIRRTLDSLVNQEFTDFELIISDDCSADSTAQICQEYADMDPRVSVTVLSENVGQRKNFDIVLAKARGDYFMWAAGDDWWHPRFISTLLEELEAHPEAGVAMCAIERIRDDGSTFDVIRYNGESNPNNMTGTQMFLAIAGGMKNRLKYHLYFYGLWRRAVLSLGRGYAHLSVPHPDGIFMCQFPLATNFRHVDEILYVRTYHYEPAEQRWGHEKHIQLANEDPWAYARMVIASGPFWLRSPVIPWRRKLLIPLGVFVMWRSYRGILYRRKLPLLLRLPGGIMRRLKWLIAGRPAV